MLSRCLLLDELFGLLQELLGRLRLISEHQHESVLHAQERACMHQCPREGVHPLEHRGDLTLEYKWERNRLDQAGSELDVGNAQALLYPFGTQPVLLVPAPNTPIQ